MPKVAKKEKELREKRSKELFDIVSSEFKELVEETRGKLLLQDGSLLFIQMDYEKTSLFYVMQDRYDTKELVTNEISIMPKFDENIYSKVLNINYNIAKKMGCQQINTEMLTGDEQPLLEKAGYRVEEGKYIGFRKVE